MGALLAERFGQRVHTERDHLLIEPDELRKKAAPANDTSFYHVYTPFARRWFEMLASPRLRARVDEQRAGLAALERRAGGAAPEEVFSLTWPALFGGAPPLDDHLERFTQTNTRRVRVPMPAAGSDAALNRLRAFSAHVAHYQETRDLPAEDGTSRLSIHFKNGSLTITQAIAALQRSDGSPTSPG